MPTDIPTLTHLVCNILNRLVALDEGDGQLNFETFFRPVAKEYEGTNGPLIIAVMLGGGILEFLVRHTIIRVLGTCLVLSCLETKQPSATGGDSEAAGLKSNAKTSTSVFSLLRRTKLLRSRLRRSISYALAYSLASGFCSWLASLISTSYLWLAFAEISTVVFLERVHLKWTLSIASKTPRAVSSDWRSLWLPAMCYGVARKLVAEVPELIGSWFVGTGDVTSADTVATRDVAVLISAFTLRFFILYPAWASLISFETRQITQKADNPGQRDHTHGHVLKLCYRKVLLRLASLHLQAAGIMIGIELGVYVVLHFLLHVPSTLPPQT